MSSPRQTSAEAPTVSAVPASGERLPVELPSAEPVARLKRRRVHAYRLRRWICSPRPLLMLTGFSLFFAFWLLAVDVLGFWRFRYMPGLWEVVVEWTSRKPKFGISIFTGEYYTHIWFSLRRVLIAFSLALVLGVPLGLFLGWYRKFKEYTFPVFEMLRPIPVLAWVPLAILMFRSEEGPVIFLT